MQTIELTGPTDSFSARSLQDLPPGPLKVVLDSPGGCIVSGLACYHALREHDGDVTVEIIRAGSAAVPIALAGDHRLIHGAGHFFVHGAWGSTVGRERDMYEAARTFRKQNRLYAGILAERTGLTLRAALKIMLDESQLSSTEAVRLGFADSIIGKPTEPPPRPSSPLERTALAALSCERRRMKPEAQKLCVESKPIAMCVPGAPALLDRPGEPLPKISPHEHASGEALERFVEAQQRLTAIRFSLELRLRRAVEFGGHVTWPVRSAWICSTCNEKNYGPPEKNRLANPCRICGATFDKEET